MTGPGCASRVGPLRPWALLGTNAPKVRDSVVLPVVRDAGCGQAPAPPHVYRIAVLRTERTASVFAAMKAANVAGIRFSSRMASAENGTRTTS